jgi:crossover junction endodeoxyribonuclease RusA
MSVRVVLGWPNKVLNPNSRPHHMALWRAKKDAKDEAGWATKSALGRRAFAHEGRIPIHFIATPPVQRDRDDDNLVASTKAHLDAIAKALGVNDKQFIAPTIEWKEPVAPGSLVIEVGNG